MMRGDASLRRNRSSGARGEEPRWLPRPCLRRTSHRRWPRLCPWRRTEPGQRRLRGSLLPAESLSGMLLTSRSQSRSSGRGRDVATRTAMTLAVDGPPSRQSRSPREAQIIDLGGPEMPPLYRVPCSYHRHGRGRSVSSRTGAPVFLFHAHLFDLLFLDQATV